MSTSKLISKESLSAYERWELPNVEEPEPRPEEAQRVEEEEAEVQPLTAEQLEEIQREAHSEGYEAGHREGYEAGMKAAETEVQHIAHVVRSLAEPLAEVDEQVEQELVELALAIAHQVVFRQLQAEPEEILTVVRETLTALPSASQNIRLFLHPEDAALVRDTFSAEQSGEQPWRIVEDGTLTRGGARVESDTSRIDATVEKRLNIAVAEALGGERTDGGSGH